MEWSECKGDVEGVERVLWLIYVKDGGSSVVVFELDKVLVGRSAEMAVSVGTP